MSRAKRRLNFGREDYENSIFLLEQDDDEEEQVTDDVVDISEDEPLFLLRAQDVNAADRVRDWADKLEAMGGCAMSVRDARERADKMDTWRQDNGGQMPSIMRETQ